MDESLVVGDRHDEARATLARLQDLWPVLEVEGNAMHVMLALLDYTDGETVVKSAKAVIAECREMGERPPAAVEWLQGEIERLDAESWQLVPEFG